MITAKKAAHHLSEDLRHDIVLACKILVNQGLDSGPFGNISIRVPGTDQFYINPAGITFDQLQADDISLMDLRGNMLSGKHRVHPGEFIHREIFRLREDVGAIVHTHSENTVAISLLGCAIEPFTQLGAALLNDQGIYHGFTGPVRDSNEGTSIAQALEDKSIVIAKNHGLFAAGSTIQAALWDMIVADMAAKIHLTAKRMGIDRADLLPEEHIQKSRIEVREKQNLFMWESYLSKLKGK